MVLLDALSLLTLVALLMVHGLSLLLSRRQKPAQQLSGWLARALGGITTPRLTAPPPPRPWGLPVIGNMISLGLKPNPYECMTDMSRQLGAVFGLRLGGTDAVVVNDLSSIREVLVTKGDHFDGRPNFLRYHQLFGGDRDNCE